MGLKKILTELLWILSHPRHPKNLLGWGREKKPTRSFLSEHKLYRGFTVDELDHSELIRLETIKFPDFSCNWELFSKPSDIKYREGGSKKDGCYSFTVAQSRFKNIATPVHEPLYVSDGTPNYSHVEVRVLPKGESIYSEPPKKKRLNSPRKKLEYRQFIREKLVKEFEPLF